MSDITDVNDVHAKPEPTGHYDIPNGEGYVEFFTEVPVDLDSTEPLLHIQLDVIGNPEWTGDEDEEHPRYLYRVTHGDEAKEGELTSVPIQAVLEGALALYTASAQQYVSEFSPAIQHQLIGGLVDRLSKVHGQFIDVVQSTSESDAWIAELREKHGEDHEALQADLATHLRALAAENGIDPETVERDLAELSSILTAPDAADPQES